MRILAPTFRSPVDMLRALDDYLVSHHPAGPFVTIVCGVLDTQRHTFTLASAGHTASLHYSSAKRLTIRVNPKGRPVGVRVDNGSSGGLHLSSQTIDMSEEDVVVLYTDGLIEARNCSGQVLGLAAIESVLASTNGGRPTPVELILERLNEFTEGQAADDDITLFVLRRKPTHAASGRKEAIATSSPNPALVPSAASE